LQDIVDSAGVGDIVWMPGERDDIPDVLKGIDVFVLPSLNEGISNTILEAMATGLPVVATDVGGNPELVQSEQTGFLVPAGDTDAMASAIRRYLERPELIVKHGKAARRMVEAEFGLQDMVDKYLAAYDAVMGDTEALVAEI
jgi:glycosyltransferase involved in cell wall biosynthesis